MKPYITTKVGDHGETRTLGGEKLPKSHIVVECTGWVDSLRAQTALLRLQIQEAGAVDSAAHAAFLLWLLHLYFVIGAEASDPGRVHPEYRPVELSVQQLARLEAEQQRLEADIDLSKAFIVSASNPLAAQADITATTARALERSLVRLKEAEPKLETVVLFPLVNRLSDYLFILARYLERGKHLPVDYGVLKN